MAVMGPRRTLTIAFLIAAWSGLAYGFYFEPRRPATQTNAEIAPRGWPAELDGLKVAAISDIHAGSPYIDKAKLEDLVRRVNGAAPDVVVLLGDYVVTGMAGQRFMAPEELAGVLAGLDAPMGVYAVLGNHDWWLDGPRVKGAFQTAGIRVLENEAVPLTSNGTKFRLIGLADHIERSPDPGAGLKGAGKDEPAIALIHEPDYFPEIPERIALTLAGHTHGGQVRLPWIGAPVVPSRYGQRYARGLVKEGTRQLFVTSGVGTSIIPVRFGVPPEYALLTLRSGR